MGGKIAIIGGSGLYEIDGLEGVSRIRVETPFGPPSDDIVQGRLHGAELLFLPRHGAGHRLLPGEVNARANIWALKSLGASWCLAICAVGSLKQEIAPGDLIIPDQLIDRTQRREGSFFGGGLVAHVSFADPFCPVARQEAYEACVELQEPQRRRTHPRGPYVCMEGPAFSTRAESNLHRSWGADLIGMTMLPEAKLAREAELAYATICFASDYDCWNERHADVEAKSVFAVIEQCTAGVKQVLPALLRRLSQLQPSPLAADALSTALVTDLKKAPPEALARLAPILGRYL